MRATQQILLTNVHVEDTDHFVSIVAYGTQYAILSDDLDIVMEHGLESEVMVTFNAFDVDKSETRLTKFQVDRDTAKDLAAVFANLAEILTKEADDAVPSEGN
jgi:hypothetical protein